MSPLRHIFGHPVPVLTRIERWLPGLSLIKSYQPAWLRPDLLAAISVCAILVPQGMAYGELAGMPPVAGLYAALAAMTAYALLGTSRQLMVGPEAGSAILVASTLAPIVAGDPDPMRYAALAGLLAMLTGAFLIFAGLGGLGFIADYLSKPVLTGYMNGSALIIMMSQAGKLFGISIESDDFFPQVWELLTSLGETQWPTLVFGIALIGLLVALRALAPRVPSTLVVVVVSILAVVLFNLQRFGITVVGEIPSGLPAPRIPVGGLGDVAVLIPGALSLAVLIFPDSVLTARAFAARRGYEIDANRELIALGANNVAAGLLQGFPNGASQSRTTVNDSAGVQSSLAGLFAAGILVLFLLFLTPLLAPLPNVALGAIIIVAAFGLIDIQSVRRQFELQRWSGVLAVATTLGVLSMGLVPGMLVAVVLSLFYVISKLARPHDAVLGQAEGLDGFHDIGEYNALETYPGLVVYRFDAQLFFANSAFFHDRVCALLADSKPPPRCLVLDAEAIATIDTTAAEMLVQLLNELEGQGTDFTIARANAEVRAMLDRTGLTQRIGAHNLYPSVRTAVEAFKRADRSAANASTAARVVGNTRDGPIRDSSS